MKPFQILAISLLVLCLGLSVNQPCAFSHCEIPCGIYDDHGVFNEIDLDIQTIEKAMNQINELSNDPKANMNQIVRWVNNKDRHADKIKKTVAEYFLSQRIKEPKNEEKQKKSDYLNELVYLHRLTVAAMKAKQTTDLKYVEDMKNAIRGFHDTYHKH